MLNPPIPQPATTNGKNGGFVVGPSHDQGGIQTLNMDDPFRKLEIEGGEAVINKRSLSLNEQFTCSGTPKEIVSKINELEGGISFLPGGSCKPIGQMAKNGIELFDAKDKKVINYSKGRKSKYSALVWEAKRSIYNNKPTNINDYDNEDEALEFAKGFVKDDFAWQVIVIDNINEKIVNSYTGSDFGRYFSNGGEIPVSTIEAIKSWDDHGWHYIHPKDVISLAQTHEIYAHDLDDDSEFMISDRTDKELQELVDENQFAFFSEYKIDDYQHPEIFADGGIVKDGISIRGEHWSNAELSQVKYDMEKYFNQKFEDIDRTMLYNIGAVRFGSTKNNDRFYNAVLKVEPKDSGLLRANNGIDVSEFDPMTAVVFVKDKSGKLVLKTKRLNRASDYLVNNKENVSSVVAIDVNGNEKKLFSDGGEIDNLLFSRGGIAKTAKPYPLQNLGKLTPEVDTIFNTWHPSYDVYKSANIKWAKSDKTAREQLLVKYVPDFKDFEEMKKHGQGTAVPDMAWRSLAWPWKRDIAVGLHNDIIAGNVTAAEGIDIQENFKYGRKPEYRVKLPSGKYLHGLLEEFPQYYTIGVARRKANMFNGEVEHSAPQYALISLDDKDDSPFIYFGTKEEADDLQGRNPDFKTKVIPYNPDNYFKDGGEIEDVSIWDDEELSLYLDIPIDTIKKDREAYEEQAINLMKEAKDQFKNGGEFNEGIRGFKVGDTFYETPSTKGKTRYYKITSIDKFYVKADDYDYVINGEDVKGRTSSFTTPDFEYRVSQHQISRYNEGDLYKNGGIFDRSRYPKVLGIYKVEGHNILANLEIVGFEAQNKESQALYQSTGINRVDSIGSLIVKNTAFAKLSKGEQISATDSETGEKYKITRVANLGTPGYLKDGGVIFGSALTIKDIENIKQGDTLGFIYKEEGKTTIHDIGQVDFFDETDKWRGFDIDGWPFEFERKKEIIENKNNPDFKLENIENSGTYWSLFHTSDTKKAANGAIITMPEITFTPTNKKLTYDFNYKDASGKEAMGVVKFNPQIHEFIVEVEDFNEQFNESSAREVAGSVLEAFTPHMEEHYSETSMAWGGIFKSKADRDKETEAQAYEAEQKEIKSKVKDFSLAVATIRDDYRNESITGSEYAEYKSNLIDQYKPYISKAKAYDIHVNPADLMVTSSLKGSGYLRSAEKGTDTADIKRIATDLVSGERAIIRFEAQEQDKTFKISSRTDVKYPSWYGKVSDIERYITENRSIIPGYKSSDDWATTLFKFGLVANETTINDHVEAAAHGTIIRSSDAKVRPSPNISATVYPEFFQMEGNDGNMWEIHLDSRGVHRWVKIKHEAIAEDGYWINSSIQHPGILRHKAKSMGLIHGDEKLSETDLSKIEHLGGHWPKRVQLARTLKSFHKAEDGASIYSNGGGVGNFKVDDVVYNSETNTIGIVRDVFTDGGGDLRTDADGVVSISVLEYFDKSNPKHKAAEIAPSTKKELGNKYSDNNRVEESEAKNGIDVKDFDKNGGYHYPAGSQETAKKVDLITLPKDVLGTNCANCIFVNVQDSEKGLGFCNNKAIMLPVTARMCCALWDNKGALRSWKDKANDSITAQKGDPYFWYVNGEYVGQETFHGGWEEMFALQKKDFKKINIRPEDRSKYFYAHYDSFRKGWKNVMALDKPLAENHMDSGSEKAIRPEDVAEDGASIPSDCGCQHTAAAGTIITNFDPFVNKEQESIKFVNYHETTEAINVLGKGGINKNHIRIVGATLTTLKFINNHTFKEALRILKIDSSVNPEGAKKKTSELAALGSDIKVTRNQEIASEILKQLGGSGRLNAMTGAYNFIAIENGVSFRIKNPSANYIKIVLTGKDLYNVEVGRIRGLTYTALDKSEDLQFDQLKPIIEKATGMYLSLKDGGVIYTSKDPTSNNYGINYWVGKEKGVWTIFSEGVKEPYIWKKRNEYENGFVSEADAILVAKGITGEEEDPEAFFWRQTEMKDGGEIPMKVGNVFTGTPNGAYDENYQLFNPRPAYVLEVVKDNSKEIIYEVIAVLNTPSDALKKRQELETTEGKHNLQVHWVPFEKLK